MDVGKESLSVEKNKIVLPDILLTTGISYFKTAIFYATGIILLGLTSLILLMTLLILKISISQGFTGSNIPVFMLSILFIIGMFFLFFRLCFAGKTIYDSLVEKIKTM